MQRPPRPVALGLVLSLVASLAAPASVLAEERRGPTEVMAGKLYALLGKVIEKTLARANKSDRVELSLRYRFMDAQERMLFDIGGWVRVRVPNQKLLARFQKDLESEDSMVMTCNGGVSVDAVLTPLKIEGEEVTFGLQLDLMILARELFGNIIRNAAQVAGVMALDTLASGAMDALARMSTDTAGEAIEMGVHELPALLSGEVGAVTYAAFQDPESKSLKERFKSILSTEGLVRHFAMAVVFAGVKGGMKAAGGALGLAVGTALVPGAGTFVTTLAATTAFVWFGNWVVETVGIKLPIMWKMAKIGRLYRKANGSDGGRQERLGNKLVEYRQEVFERIDRELDGSYKQWTFLQVMTRYFQARVRDKHLVENPLEAFDLTPYKPLLEQVAAKLKFMATQKKDWYAARMYYQLMDSVGMLAPGERQDLLPAAHAVEAAAAGNF